MLKNYKLFSMFLLLWSTWLPAGVTVESRVDKSEITIGDRLAYTLSVEYPESFKVEMPGAGAHLGVFELKELRDTVLSLPGRKQRAVQTFAISTFTTGKYFIPPFPIAFRDTSGKRGMILSDKIEINVKSLRTEDQKDIGDLKAQELLRGGKAWIGFAIAGALILGAAIALIYYLRRKRKASTPGPPPLPPHEAALKALAELEARQLPLAGHFKEYYFALSEIFRRYLGARYGFDALESTTEEILPRVRDLILNEPLKAWIADLCRGADLVKYADDRPPVEQALQSARDIINFIMQTMEKPPAPAGPDTADVPGKGTHDKIDDKNGQAG